MSIIRSMTAFAHAAGHAESFHFQCELRSVNHRYLEITLRLPDSLHHLEPALRELIRNYVARGKVELFVRLDQAASDHPLLNKALAEKILHLAAEIDALARHSAPVSALEVLRMPGVLTHNHATPAQLDEHVLQLASAVIIDFLHAREREGLALKYVILEKLDQLDRVLMTLVKSIPRILEEQQSRLTARLNELSLNLDSERMEQEIVLLMHRMDVSEELDRLRTHVDEFKRVIDQGGPVGRRLDFLLQEFNREANTLASKAVSSDSTLSSVELKVLIEQMREQIQNLE
ncbi:MAG: YicC family protein [Pseudomonadales bacterium]|nr:YicC family protein [Pseudomonadales bacterium]